MFFRSRKEKADTSASAYDVQPSDIGQAIVRVIFVGALVVWSFHSSRTLPIRDALKQDFLLLAVAYWLFAIFYLGWSYYLVRSDEKNALFYTIKRVVGVVTDLGAISAYTAIASTHGFILYPVYLTTIIGYGYRFGLRYLYLSIITAVALFSVALPHNPYLLSELSLILAYYIGLILVPLYSSALLKRHQIVLRRLKEVNEARSRFIANMSHELRTPLHAIISVTDVIKEEIDSTKSLADKYGAKLQMVSESAQLLLGLVNRILDIASSEAGISKLDSLGPINLYRTIRRSVDICEAKARHKGLDFNWYIDPEVPQCVISSEQHLQEILINTLENAVKYTNTGFVYVRVTGSYQNSSNHCNVLIEIIDSGIGISKQLLPTIFEPFTLGDDSAVRKFTGTGLGLTITKQHVEQMRGAISFDSTENVGTRCQISLPLIVAELSSKTQVGKKSCALVTPRSITPEEKSAFELGNWTARPMGLLLASSSAALQDVAVVMVDDEFAEHSTLVVERVKALCLDKPLICYGRANSKQPPANRCYQSRVVAGSVDHLKTLHEIINCQKTDKEYSGAVPQGRKYSLLIADDNLTNLQTAVMALEPVGHEIHTVRTGEEALEGLENDDYDLALLDMHMPGMSGAEVAGFYQFMENKDKTPIILITADVTQEARDEAKRVGITAFLSKPIRPKELRTAVQLYARRRNEQAPESALKTATDRVISIDDALISSDEVHELLDLGSSYLEIKELIEDFFSDSRVLIDQAYDAATNGRIGIIRQHLHTLKGSAATIGATTLQKRVTRIETLGLEEMAIAMANEWKELQHILLRSKQALINTAIDYQSFKSHTSN